MLTPSFIVSAAAICCAILLAVAVAFLMRRFWTRIGCRVAQGIANVTGNVLIGIALLSRFGFAPEDSGSHMPRTIAFWVLVLAALGAFVVSATLGCLAYFHVRVWQDGLLIYPRTWNRPDSAVAVCEVADSLAEAR